MIRGIIMKNMMKIASFGEIVWDILPDGRQLGGAPVNFAFYAAQFGAEACPITALGNDSLGKEAYGKLLETGLNLDLVQENMLPTGRVLVSLDNAGVPSYNIVENVSWDGIECTPKARSFAAIADAICWGSLAQRSTRSRESLLSLVDAAGEDCLKVFDINIRQDYYSRSLVENSLYRADILKLNEDEFPLLQKMLNLPEDREKAVGELIVQYSLKEVIFTQGATGSAIFDASGLLSGLPTPKVEVADTVGAGDSFTASYIAARLAGKTVSEAHALAVEVSAYVCTCHGAINPLPPALLSRI